MLTASRALAALALMAVPALALARPPLIYHHVSSVAAPSGGTLQLRLGSQDAKVSVQPGTRVTVTVDIWANASSDKAKADLIKRLAPATSTQGNGVLVQAPENEGWSWHFGWGSPDVLVTVVMPPGMNLNYRLGSGDFLFDGADAPTAIQGKSGSGDAMIKSSSKAVAVSAGSGDISVALNGAADEASLEAGSGDVNFSGSAKSLSLRTGSGDVSGHASTQSASLRSGSGDIQVHWKALAAGAAIRATAGSGDILFYFPADAVLGGMLSTGSGDVVSPFPATLSGDRHVFHLAGGDGAATLDVSTGSGDVILRKE